MAAVCEKVFGMKIRLATTMLAAGVLLTAWRLSVRAQSVPAGHATDFTSRTYYEPPHETRVKMQLSGAEASPLPGGLLDVKQLRIEMFNLDGRSEAAVTAPQCTYAPMEGEASSAGRLEMRTGDGKFRVEGEGFLWRQADSQLIISNHVHTVIKAGYFRLSAP